MIRRRLGKIGHLLKQSQPVETPLLQIEQEIQQGRLWSESRRQRLPNPTFPADLPVAQHREEIAGLIQANPVLILCGATGSGKTTQLPKICLQLGRGVFGFIGMTQPRRIAARAISGFLAKDLPSPQGPVVGFKIRFSDGINDNTLIKIMTDGILLAEIQSDPDLLHYDTLIIDEAHERSLNIDFLLGHIKRLLPKRPELKVIISSATLDTEKFSRHFDNAPVIEISGRTWPVETRYRPLGQPMEPSTEEVDEADLKQGVVAAIDELAHMNTDGDILVFLPGEGEIRELTEALRKHRLTGWKILPLFARLSTAEQNVIFNPSSQRRVILATNVAETSITVPGVRYVIDSGLARISRFSGRSGVQRLPVERISRSSADQRQGRCGRLMNGICIRLYSEESYHDRPHFTDPEILRTSLAEVILRLKAYRLGSVAQFPFIDPPKAQAIREGVALLLELGALDTSENLTKIGHDLARLPLDPRLGRMVLAGAETNCLDEILILTAALSLRDPRERPQAHRQAADIAHNRFLDPTSDFSTLLKLWGFIFQTQAQARSKTQFRKIMQENFLSPVRSQEWIEIHAQLTRLVKEMGMTSTDQPANSATIHQALLTGLLGYVGLRTEKQEYSGPRGIIFYLFPGSGLFQTPPAWIMAFELVETSRLYARTVAAIEPDWIERVAPTACRRSWSEPHWQKKTGHVTALERVVYQGLILVAGRRIHYGPIDPIRSREIFIRSALTQGNLITKAPFFLHNQHLIEEIQTLENRIRRRDLLVDEEVIFQFFDQRIPKGIYTQHAFDQWRHKEELKNPTILFLSLEFLLRHGLQYNPEQAYPGHLIVNNQELSLEYHFEPGQESDGLNVRIPSLLLAELPEEPFEWLVAGLLPEKILALFKRLPIHLRRQLVPLPKSVERCLEDLVPHSGNLYVALSKTIKRQTGIDIPQHAWRADELPNHLRIYFKIFDETSGRILQQGRDLLTLRQQRPIPPPLPRQQEGNTLERARLIIWDFGPLPEQVVLYAGQTTLQGFPTLQDQGDSVRLTVLTDQEMAHQQTRGGLIRLFLLQLSQQVRLLEKKLPLSKEMAQAYAPLGSVKNLRQEILLLTTERLFLPETAPIIRDAQTFQARLQAHRATFVEMACVVCQQVERILLEYQKIKPALAKQLTAGRHLSAAEIRSHLDHLIPPGFLRHTPKTWLDHFPRYLRAIQLRLERLDNAPLKDVNKKTEQPKKTH
ncbi:MAG: ATP-dependent RNA helicase HrpA [Magnetococcus sp. DMHC-6]